MSTVISFIFFILIVFIGSFTYEVLQSFRPVDFTVAMERTFFTIWGALFWIALQKIGA